MAAVFYVLLALHVLAVIMMVYCGYTCRDPKDRTIQVTCYTYAVMFVVDFAIILSYMKLTGLR